MYSKLEKFRYLKVLLPAVTGFFLLAFGVNAFGSPPEFVTICHAAGRAGTTKFVTLKLPVNAVFGQAGHFNEPGTPNAGHEQDYLGACVGPSPSLQPLPSPSPASSPTPSPSSGGNNTNNNQNNQSQSQTNNQTVNVTVEGTTIEVNEQVLGTKTPSVQPETGVSVLGMAAVATVAPLGLALSRFGRGRISSKQEETLETLASGLVRKRILKKKTPDLPH